MAIKFFSSKSNRDRALRKMEVGQAVEIDGRYGIEAYEPGEDEAPAKQVAEIDASDHAPEGATSEAATAAEMNAIVEAAYEPEAAAQHETFADAVAARDAPPAPLSVMLQISVDTVDAKRLATMVARYLSRTVEIVSPAAGLVEIVSPGAKPRGAAPRAPKAPRGPAAPRTVIDPSVKPIITSASNQRMQALIDRIAEARGDVGKLTALNTFRRSATYYKLAGRYLDALIAEASTARAA